MKTARILAVLLLLLPFLQDISVPREESQAPSKKPQRPIALAFVNVNVVPMDSERILPQQTVIVRGDRISEVGPADTIDMPEGAFQIDSRDKYLMPGLVDMHVHQNHKYQLTLFIANGVTTIRNMSGREYDQKLREQIEKGNLFGPSIYTTGPIIDGVPWTSPFGRSTISVETPEQAAQVVAEHKKARYDFIKVYSRLSLEGYDGIIEAAAKHGMPVVGHVPWAVSLEHALAAGQHSVEHLTGYDQFLKVEGSSIWQEMDETKIPHIVQMTRESGTWNCVTLVVFQKRRGMSSQEAEQEDQLPYMNYIPPYVKQVWKTKRLREQDHNCRMLNRKRLTKALHDAGARILLGSDTPAPYVLSGFSLHQELQNLIDAGLTPYEAIKAGTRNAAECLGELDEFGIISPGLRADFVLIEGNPLEDVGNAARRTGVMVRGRWFPQSELQVMLDKLAIKHATEENPDGVMLRGRWYPRFELEAMVDAQNRRKEAEKMAEVVLSSRKIFLVGTGRSEPVARSVARQLMRAGLEAYFAGDATTPSTKKGDLLIAISSSGQTTKTYNIVSAAKNSGAVVVLLTSRSRSRIGKISDQVHVIDFDFYESTGAFFDELVTLIAKKRGKNFTSHTASTLGKLPELQTVEDVLNWCRANLYYRNVDKWDRAPQIESVIRDGYGDCKMLAGVVSVFLDSVGQPNEYIVIKKRAWHMFNAYRKNGKLYVINNARLVDKEFTNYEDIKGYFEVKEFKKVFHNYDDFRSWFNTDIYQRND